MKLITQTLLLTLIIVTSACDSDKQPECPECVVECNDGKLHECCIDDDCLIPDCPDDYTMCNDDYECECVCYEEGEDCSRDPEACCDGLACDIFTNTCIVECTSDDDCVDGAVCKNGVCEWPCDPCRSNDDCVGLDICLNGCCEGITIPPCSEIEECVVAPPSAVTTTGSTAHFAATPYLRSGAIAPGHIFTWSSSEDAVASVTGGLATGGVDSGISTITAVVDQCESITCNAVLTNYGTLPAGFTRVVVVDEFTGSPIQGATVVLGAEPPVATDVIGIAVFSGELSDANPGDITVSKRDYDYVTLKGVKVDDVVVHLSPLYHLDFTRNPPVEQAGGIVGRFDFGMVRCDAPFKTCNVSLGLAGMSVPPNLAHMNINMLYGSLVMREIELGGQVEQVPLPTSLVLCLDQECFDGGIYRAIGVPGNRVAWGIGGKLDMDMLVDALGPLDGEGNVVLELSKYFFAFYTSMIPNVEIDPVPFLPNETPDFSSFTDQDMTLLVGMHQMMAFNPPTLPVGIYDEVAVLGGIIVKGAGFVPLGLAAGKDSLDENDIPDGVIDDPIILDIADVAGRIPEGQLQRIVVAFALKVEHGEPKDWAGQVMFVDSFSGTHTLPGFMLPVEAAYDAAGRRLEVVGVPEGAEFIQAVFAGENESSWHVLTEEFGSFDLPAAPVEGDRAGAVGVYAVDLYAGGYQEMVEFNDLNMGSGIVIVGAFSYSEVP